MGGGVRWEGWDWEGRGGQGGGRQALRERWAGEGRGGQGPQNVQDPLYRPRCAGIAGASPEPTPLPKLLPPAPRGRFPIRVQVPINISLKRPPQQRLEETARLPRSQGGTFHQAWGWGGARRGAGKGWPGAGRGGRGQDDVAHGA